MIKREGEEYCKNDLYGPRYTDLLRVAFTSEFHRGRLSDLANLLSGRNFETRTYEEEIAQQSFEILEKGYVGVRLVFRCEPLGIELENARVIDAGK